MTNVVKNPTTCLGFLFLKFFVLIFCWAMTSGYFYNTDAQTLIYINAFSCIFLFFVLLYNIRNIFLPIAIFTLVICCLIDFVGYFFYNCRNELNSILEPISHFISFIAAILLFIISIALRERNKYNPSRFMVWCKHYYFFPAIIFFIAEMLLFIAIILMDINREYIDFTNIFLCLLLYHFGGVINIPIALVIVRWLIYPYENGKSIF